MIRLQNRKVLIVDDRPDNRLYLCDLVAKWGMLPTLTSSAEEALVYIRNGIQFDVALIDICMPYMSGIDLASEIRKDRKSLPLIALSSLDKKQSIDFFNYYLMKPVNPSELYQAISASVINTGTTKLDSLVFAREPITTTSTSTVSTPRARKTRDSLTVLIAEDDQNNSYTLREMLISLGISEDNICVVYNGQECVDIVKSKGFDIVFMDIIMPVMNGLDATKHIRQLSNPPIIIAISAAIGKTERERCHKVGIDAFLTKPLLKGTLESTLDNLVDNDSEISLKHVSLDKLDLEGINSPNSDDRLYFQECNSVCDSFDGSWS